MTTVSVLRRWLKSLPPDAQVFIGEDAMTLRTDADDENYIELGAAPEENATSDEHQGS